MDNSAQKKTAAAAAPTTSRGGPALRVGTAVAAIATGALAAVLWLGILAGSEVRHTAGPGADVAMWLLAAGAAGALVSGIVLARRARRRGGPVPLAVAGSAVLVLIGALLEDSLGVFEFGSAGGVTLAVLLAGTVALTALVLTAERPGTLPRPA
ncbi:hypothetical protein [Sinomonas soli]